MGFVTYPLHPAASAMASILTERLGHNGERYVIPILDSSRQAEFVKLYLPGGHPKFLAFPAGAGSTLFGAETLKGLPSGSTVIITEGELDALALRSRGFNAVSGTAGAKTWRPEWSKLLKRFGCRVIGDSDDDGRYMSVNAPRLIREAGGWAVALEWPEDTQEGTDCTDWLVRDRHSVEEFQELIDQALESDRTTSLNPSAS